jgi:hypothetical protein
VWVDVDGAAGPAEFVQMLVIKNLALTTAADELVGNGNLIV